MAHLNVSSNSVELTGELRRQSVLYDALTPKKMELTLFPTEKCNFRCKYCYEDFAVGRMSRDVIDGVKHLIEKRAPELEFLRIAWFGGEPFIAYDIIKEIMQAAHDLASVHDFAFSSSATTNGYNLSRERFIEMEALGLRKYQISLDGDRDGHNLTRLRIDGKGTFDKIWANVLLFNELRSQGVLTESSVILRIHVHPHNVESVHRLSAMISAELDPNFFTIHIENIGHYGGPNDDSFDIFKPAQDVWKSLIRQLYGDLARYRPEMDADSYVCYASKANHFIIRADGGVGKCTVALRSRNNAVGKLHPDGSMELYQDRLNPWLHGLRSMDKDDLACPVMRLPKLEPNPTPDHKSYCEPASPLVN